MPRNYADFNQTGQPVGGEDTQHRFHIMATEIDGTIRIDPTGTTIQPVTVVGGTITGTFTVASEGPTGAPVPSEATYIGGINPSGKLTGLTMDTAGNLNVNTVAQFTQIDANNSTTTPLLANATFTGTATDAVAFAAVTIGIKSDVASATNGFQIQFSSDGVNWDYIAQTTYLAGVGVTCPSGVRAKWFRVVYTNGPVNQTYFRMSSTLLPVTLEVTKRFLSAPPSSDQLALLTQASLVGADPNGLFHNVMVDGFGNLNTVSADSFATGSITSTQTVVIPTQGRSTVVVQIRGTWTGEVDYEVTVDGANWHNVTNVLPTTALLGSTTVNTCQLLSVGGFEFFRVRGNTVTSGEALITLQCSTGIQLFSQGSFIDLISAGFIGTPQPNGPFVDVVGGLDPSSNVQALHLDASNSLLVSGGTAIFEVSPTTAANTKTNPFFNAISDGTNGPVAVKAASVAATAADPALVVTTNGSTTAGAPANTSVTSTSSTALAANVARRECTIVNTDVVVVYLGLGQVPTATAYHIALTPCTVAHDGTGGTYTTDLWKGAINAIVASTSGHVSVTELT